MIASKEFVSCMSRILVPIQYSSRRSMVSAKENKVNRSYLKSTNIRGLCDLMRAMSGLNVILGRTLAPSAKNDA